MYRKLALRAAHSEPGSGGERACWRLQPHQLAHRTPLPERKAHTCLSRSSLSGLDCTSAGTASRVVSAPSHRQALLDQAARRFPEATALLNLFYGVDGPAYMTGVDGSKNALSCSQSTGTQVTVHDRNWFPSFCLGVPRYWNGYKRRATWSWSCIHVGDIVVPVPPLHIREHTVRLGTTSTDALSAFLGRPQSLIPRQK